MGKKHYMCTHTWSNPDTVKDIIKQQGEMTDKEFFAGLKSEKAETLQHWMGKDDFFFCHWYAEDEHSCVNCSDCTWKLCKNGVSSSIEYTAFLFFNKCFNDLVTFTKT